MKSEKFEELKELEYRIKSLEFLKIYLQHLFEGAMFGATIHTKILGHESMLPIFDISGLSVPDSHRIVLLKETDGALITGAIQQRIDALKKEFEAA